MRFYILYSSRLFQQGRSRLINRGIRMRMHYMVIKSLSRYYVMEVTLLGMLLLSRIIGRRQIYLICISMYLRKIAIYIFEISILSVYH